MKESKTRAKQREQCLSIKRLLEKESNVMDIGIRSRKRKYVEIKKMYSYLCKEFTESSLTLIGGVLGGYDHATVLYAIETFKDLLGSGQIDLIDIYEKVYKRIKNEGVRIGDQKSLDQIEQENRLRAFAMSKKYHNVINRQLKEINRLKEFEKAINNIEVELEAV